MCQTIACRPKGRKLPKLLVLFKKVLSKDQTFYKVVLRRGYLKEAEVNLSISYRYVPKQCTQGSLKLFASIFPSKLFSFTSFCFILCSNQVKVEEEGEEGEFCILGSFQFRKLLFSRYTPQSIGDCLPNDIHFDEGKNNAKFSKT